MPSFYVDDVDIDVDEFLSACNDSEIKELVQALADDGYIKRESILKPGKRTNAEFDDACTSLIGNSWRLTKEDEEAVINIFKRNII